MANELPLDTKAAADAAFLFLTRLAPPHKTERWRLALGRKVIDFQPASDEAYGWLARNIRSSAGCNVVLKGLQTSRHIAVEARAANRLAVFPAKPAAIVKAAGTTSMLWRLLNPVDASKASELARNAARAIGGVDLDFLFPLPGSIRHGRPVAIAKKFDATAISTVTQFLSVATPAKAVSVVNIQDPALAGRAGQLVGALSKFGVGAKATAAYPGPVVTMYDLEPEAGVRASKIAELAGDLAIALKAPSVRIVASPERSAVGVEIPNEKPEIVPLSKLLPGLPDANAILPLALGVSTIGEPVIADLAAMPHLLLAGATGAGKSVGLNCMILSLLYGRPPEAVNFLMIDPKMVELSIYGGIPHLLAPVITDKRQAVEALEWAVGEMGRRYQMLLAAGVRNIAAYNRRAGPLPYTVIVIDEVANLMSFAKPKIEAAIESLVALGRACGVHIIVATQRPSVDVLGGVIKANFPCRIAFQVSSATDSQVILGKGGAELLLGRGDMLFQSGSKIQRVHGAFVSDDEVETAVRRMREQGRPDYRFGARLDCDQDSGPKLIGANKTGRERVADALRSGPMTTSALERAAGVSRARLKQFQDEGLIRKTESGRDGLWSLKTLD